MHPYRKRYESVVAANGPGHNKPDLKCLPPAKHTQLQCALTGGSVANKQNNQVDIIKATDDNDVEMVPIVVVTKCPCCKRTVSTETVNIKASDSNFYYYSFVMNSIPGIIKYDTCGKCSGVKLTVIK